jgi:L-alanine-DL-glutamate epimerase-like enolase superfamily enzyme
MATVQTLEADAYRIPTDRPESDGTLAWDHTTLVTVHVAAEGETGFGYTYSHEAAALLARTALADVVTGRDPLDVDAAWQAMRRAVRNLGRPGVANAAVAAVDTALWDLKARLLGRPLAVVLDAPHRRVRGYGSGGFTSYSVEELEAQLSGWAAAGLPAVKMKVGREPERDVARVRAARKAVGDAVDLYVDANGAYTRKQALALAGAFADLGVTWFEEPVSSDDLEGLRLLRDRALAGMEIAAGEYGYTPDDFRRLLETGAVDVLQADATRCGGPSGFRRAAVLAEAFHVPLSAHTAPTLHAHVGCAALPLRNVEVFHDHARIEEMLFDGAVLPHDGWLEPPRDRPGLGVRFRRERARAYLVSPEGASA